MKITMKNILATVLLLQLSAFTSYAAESSLCEKAAGNQISFSNLLQIRTTPEFSVITWNAHKLTDRNFMPDLIQLSHETDVILIQEAMHNSELQSILTTKFDFSFSFNKSFCTSDKQATGVMNASRYLLLNNSTLVSPDLEPVTNTPKVSGYSAVSVPEIGVVHIINTHGLNFDIGSKFDNQINKLAQFIQTLEGPVIWAGDFNTWSAGRLKHLDKKAKELGLSHLLPTTDNRSQKLDHVYIKGLEVIDVQILENIRSSDHLPMKAIFKKI